MDEETIKNPSRISKIRNWYGKYERPISSLSLIGGFVFDAVFLKRVDVFWENFWVVLHLVVIATCMVFVHALEKNEGDETNPSKAHFWLVNIIQFTFGGVLSVFLVFYFRSSDISASWPFLLILALAFWANESLKRHYVRLVFQISLFYLSLISFAIFLIPVVFHRIGSWIFVLSALLSLVVAALFVLLISYAARSEFEKSKKWLYATIGGIFALVNILYFTNLIPPIPLSLKSEGVYHSLKRQADGNYLAITEVQNWKRFFTLYPVYHKLAGEGVTVYSAIFAPSFLNTTVIHEWQHQNEKGDWVTANKVNLHIVGGRVGGFRTFSSKTNIAPGKWRVNVLTTRGQLIGRIRFKVEIANELPRTEQKVND